MTEEHEQHEQQTEAPDAGTGTATEDGNKNEKELGEAPAPEGTTPTSDLFDLMGDEGKQFKKPDPQKESKAQDPKKTPTVAARKYPAGMEIHHAGQKISLPDEMTETEVFAFLADDFPEVTADRAEIREDKQKNRLVVAFKSFKKG